MKFFSLIAFVLLLCGVATAQMKTADALDRVKRLKVFESTREDVRRVMSIPQDQIEDFNEGEIASVEAENMSLQFTFALDGCDGGDWNVKNDTLTEIFVRFTEPPKPSEIDINLKNLVEIEDEDEDSTYYYDPNRALGYEVEDGRVNYVKYAAPQKYFGSLCKFGIEEREYDAWLRKTIAFGYKVYDEFSYANVENLTLDRFDLFLGNGANCDSPKVVVTTDYDKAILDPVTFHYTVSAGKIEGTGAIVVWNLAGATPGIHTVTAGVDNGCGVCGKTMTKTVEVKVCPLKP